MKRRGVRLLALLWIAWYISGPLAETVDYWDSPREEIADVARSAGGAVTLLAATICLTFALLRKLRERCSSLACAIRRECLPLIGGTILKPLAVPIPSTSSPHPLRI